MSVIYTHCLLTVKVNESGYLKRSAVHLRAVGGQTVR
jgi:hypothetical protein